MTIAAVLLALPWRGQRTRLSPRVSEEIPGIAGRVAVAAVLAGLTVGDAAIASLVKGVPIASALVISGRALAYAVRRALASRLVIAEPTIILGSGQLGASIAETLLRHPEYGFSPIGFVDAAATPDLPLMYLGETQDLASIAERHGAGRVIVAFGSIRDEQLVPILRTCDRSDLEIFVVPRLFELAAEAGATDEIWGFPVVRLHRTALRTGAWRAKRAFDVAAASMAFAVGAPLLGLIALAVRLSSPGPILFRQKRVGRDGLPIEIMKFRTLEVNDDSDTTWNVVNDERLTPVGKFLRRTHLDELPQLFSILRGDMSLVGPRPERPYYVELFSAEVNRYTDRHRVSAGLTGWSQVHGLSGDTSIQERARFDNRYIERWTLWRDVTILVRTAGSVFWGILSALAKRPDPQAEQANSTDESATSLARRSIDLRDREIDLRPIEGNGVSSNGHRPQRDERPDRSISL
jgi:exopolysaccharide biosynthesis polyprenyl glycosylphosphotransferase